MASYKADFDANSALLIAAMSTMPGKLEEELPGMSIAKFKKLLVTISYHLGKLDKSVAKFPEYLAYSSTYLPSFAAAYCKTAEQYVPNGAQYFVANAMPQFTEIHSRLEKALGVDAEVVRNITQSQINELQQILDQSRKILGDIAEVQADSAGIHEIIRENGKMIGQRAFEASAAADSVKAAKNLAEKLIGEKNSKYSLDFMSRAAREKLDIFDSIQVEILASQNRVSELEAEIHRLSVLAADSQIGITIIKDKANDILHGATQAGLAGAYRKERDRLSTEQRNCAYIFYGGALAVVGYAAVFILPVFSKLFDGVTSPHFSTSEALLILLVRVSILGPAIWALIFTNARYSKLEILQMDYAAKANTALAYSGYRDEMIENKDLGNRLKDGLLVRFLEHPERLLRKTQMKERVAAGPTGVTYESENFPSTLIEPTVSLIPHSVVTT